MGAFRSVFTPQRFANLAAAPDEYLPFGRVAAALPVQPKQQERDQPMKADVSRVTFDPRRHATSVRKQQGRVDLDADWNEQQDIDDHLRSDHPARHRRSPPARRSTTPGLRARRRGGDLKLSAGRYYVDGVLCENDDAGLRLRPTRPAGRLPVVRRARRDVAVDARARCTRRLRAPTSTSGPGHRRRRRPGPARGRARRPGHHDPGPDRVAGAPAACRRPGRRRHAAPTTRRAGTTETARPPGTLAVFADPTGAPVDRLHHPVVGAVPRSRQPVLPRRDPRRRARRAPRRYVRSQDNGRCRHVGRRATRRADA